MHYVRSNGGWGGGGDKYVWPLLRFVTKSNVFKMCGYKNSRCVAIKIAVCLLSRRCILFFFRFYVPAVPAGH